MRLNKLILFIFLIFILQSTVYAETRELGVKIYGPQDFSDIWLGISTGGYRLLAEKGTDYNFRIFIKNGMSERAINNFQIIEEEFPFKVKDINPRSFEQIKPMEVVIIWVSAEIPEDTSRGVYPLKFGCSAVEFPQGVFTLESEIKVVKKIRKIYYPIYTIIILGLIALLIYRKYKIKKINDSIVR